MILNWSSVCMRIPCCLVISLLTCCMCSQTFHTVNIRRVPFSLIRGSFLLHCIHQILLLICWIYIIVHIGRYLINIHAPKRTYQMSRKPLVPSRNRDIQDAKRRRWYYEGLWSSSSCVFIIKCSRFLKLKLKCPCLCQIIILQQTDQSQGTVFGVVNEVVHKSQSPFRNKLDMSHRLITSHKRC